MFEIEDKVRINSLLDYNENGYLKEMRNERGRIGTIKRIDITEKNSCIYEVKTSKGNWYYKEKDIEKVEV